MPHAADPYSLHHLADLAEVTPRTVRYYISQGLLPSPSQVGPGARYGDRHLDRIRLIKLLQREHLPLAEIRARLAKMDDQQVAELAHSTAPRRQAKGSAADYVRSVLGESAPAYEAPAVQMRAFSTSAPAPAPAPPRPSSLPPDRSQWDRITLTPDVELHVRRPLTRHHNRLVDRLIATARQLFEEEPS
jgi:DNA-binding transcriptional MerR regulator